MLSKFNIIFKYMLGVYYDRSGTKKFRFFSFTPSDAQEKTLLKPLNEKN